MTKPIWKPTPDRIAQSNMLRFINFVAKKNNIHLKDYHELFQWSLSHPEKFWPMIWEFASIKASQSWDQVLVNPKQMLGSQWFTNARLNFAENLLRRRDDKTALIFVNENSTRRSLSYAELFAQVSNLANAFKTQGIKIDDRVAAFLPNLPETVIGMLATTSIGAIWSSCSADFGLNGLTDRFGQIQPKILLTTDGYQYNGKIYSLLSTVAQLQAAIPSIEKIIMVPYLESNPDISHIPNAILYSDFIANQQHNLTFAQLPFSHPGFILYSSGTTDVPKCIVHSTGGTLIQHLKELILHTDVKENDTIFYYTSCGWMMWNWMISSLAIGATVVLYDGSPLFPKPSRMFDLIDQEKITIFGTSARYISAIAKENLKPEQTHSLNSLKTILSTGSPLLPENFDYVYQNIKSDLCLSSISGGTDIISCFALGNPILPVYRGELQCIGLGLNVEVFDEEGHSVREEKGELVCTAPFPAMPVYFWNDPERKKYFNAYFTRFPNVWAHGDYAEITEHDGVIIYGRADAVLKPSGVRIGTAEIYRSLENMSEILEAVAVGQEWQGDIRIILFVKLRGNLQLTEELKNLIKTTLRREASPHHVPAKIIQVADIPKTINNKTVELAVREIIHNRPVKNIDAIANPASLEYFKNLTELNQ